MTMIEIDQRVLQGLDASRRAAWRKYYELNSALPEHNDEALEQCAWAVLADINSDADCNAHMTNGEVIRYFATKAAFLMAAAIHAQGRREGAGLYKPGREPLVAFERFPEWSNV